jgi:hypothetical protein
MSFPSAPMVPLLLHCGLLSYIPHKAACRGVAVVLQPSSLGIFCVGVRSRWVERELVMIVPQEHAGCGSRQQGAARSTATRTMQHHCTTPAPHVRPSEAAHWPVDAFMMLWKQRHCFMQQCRVQIETVDGHQQ